MEYAIVTFPESRTVYIDGEEGGTTNVTMRLNAGRHVFDLGEPKNYRPKKRTVAVSGTSSIRPKEIVFEKINDPGVA